MDANSETGRDNCTAWYNQRPRKRRNVHQDVLRKRAGVYVPVCTYSVSATLSFFFTDEMQVLVIQATNENITSLYCKNVKIVGNIELMTWTGLLSELGWTRKALGQ